MTMGERRPVFLYLFLIAWAAVCVQWPPTRATAGEAGYVVGPRDVLALVVFAGGEKQYEADLTVSASGFINVPFIGPLKVEGLSLPQLEAAIVEPLAKDYFVNPEANVVIREYNAIEYSISGAVKSPGTYRATSKCSLMELLAKAGGVLPERGNVAFIARSAGKGGSEESGSNDPTVVDLKRLLDQGDMRLNIMLESGDLVYIPLEKALNQDESKIYVEGEVKNPGVYDFQPGLTAMNACLLAGGFDQFAAPNRTRIIRKEEEKQLVIKINLEEVKKGKIQDIELKPGDRIHVPETWL